MEVLMSTPIKPLPEDPDERRSLLDSAIDDTEELLRKDSLLSRIVREGITVLGSVTFAVFGSIYFIVVDGIPNGINRIRTIFKRS
jgi:hypothetical protein